MKHWAYFALLFVAPVFAADIVLEGIAPTDARQAPNGDWHVSFAQAAPAVPACNVSILGTSYRSAGGLSSASPFVMLKVSCGVPLTSIHWFLNGVSLRGDVAVVSPKGDAHLLTDLACPEFPPKCKSLSFTATGNGGEIPAGDPAVIVR